MAARGRAAAAWRLRRAVGAPSAGSMRSTGASSGAARCRHQHVVVLARERRIRAAPELAFLPHVKEIDANDHASADPEQT